MTKFGIYHGKDQGFKRRYAAGGNVDTSPLKGTHPIDQLDNYLKHGQPPKNTYPNAPEGEGNPDFEQKALQREMVTPKDKDI